MTNKIIAKKLCLCQKLKFSLTYVFATWAENFRMVDIAINASSSLFLNIETNLIMHLYPEKCIQFNQSGSHIWSWLIWILRFKINIQKQKGLYNFKKLVFDISLLYPGKNGLRRNSKVCPLDTLIDINSKVFSSDNVNLTYFIWQNSYCEISKGLQRYID